MPPRKKAKKKKAKKMPAALLRRFSRGSSKALPSGVRTRKGMTPTPAGRARPKVASSRTRRPRGGTPLKSNPRTKKLRKQR